MIIEPMAVPKCPLCGPPMQSLRLANESFAQCETCGGIWIARGTILALRGRGLADHPSLVGTDLSPRRRFDQLACPQCARPMHIYNYRGGGVRVDQCSSCDHFFLDGGELSEILREWDEGLELSDQARGALLTHHASQAAATEGPDFGLLLWILVLVVWIALEAVGLFTRQGMSSPVFFVGLLFLLGMVGVGVWRRIRAQRHTAHELHLARVRELGGIDQPEAKEREFSAKILGKGEEKPQHPLATPEPLRSEAASYRQAAPETRLKAEAGGSPAFPKSSSRK